MEEIIKVNLTPEEQAALEKSVELIRSTMAHLT
jgi:malate/lactate dehydrogenase